MTTSQASTSDQVAVAELPRRITEAWAKHDADGFATVFTEDGTMILPGLYLKGRAAIRDYMAQAFSGPYRGTRVTGQPFHLSVLSPDVVVLLTEGGVIEAGRSELAEEGAIRATWIAVKRDGQWQLAGYQNTPR